MAKRRNLLFGALLFLCVTTTSQAAVVGFSAEGGVGQLSGEGDHTPSQHAIYSFTFDTDPSAAHLCNYRLDLGYARTYFGDIGVGSGLAMENTLGFRFYGDETTRLWFGPQLRTGWMHIRDDSYLDFGLGPVLGLTVKLSDNHYLAATAGYRWIGHTQILGRDLNTNEGFVSLGFLFR